MVLSHFQHILRHKGLAFLLPHKEGAQEGPEGIEVPLVGEAHPVPLAVVQVRGVLVGRVGERLDADGAAPVQFNLYVNVAHDLVGGGAVNLLLVAHRSVHDDAVVEQLRAQGHIEDIAARLGGLVVQAHVQRDVQFLENVVDLARHDAGYIGEQHIGTAGGGDAGFFAGQEVAGDEQVNELLLHLVHRVQGCIHLCLCGGVQVRDVNAEIHLRIAQPAGDGDAAVHGAAVAGTAIGQ